MSFLGVVVKEAENFLWDVKESTKFFVAIPLVLLYKKENTKENKIRPKPMTNKNIPFLLVPDHPAQKEQKPHFLEVPGWSRTIQHRKSVLGQSGTTGKENIFQHNLKLSMWMWMWMWM